jgi:hypothetical protein
MADRSCGELGYENLGLGLRLRSHFANRERLGLGSPFRQRVTVTLNREQDSRFKKKTIDDNFCNDTGIVAVAVKRRYF